MAGLVSKSSTAMKLLIFAIAVVTLGAISQAKTANIEFGEALREPQTAKPCCGRGSTIGGVTRTCREDALLLVSSQRAVSRAYNQSTFVDKLVPWTDCMLALSPDQAAPLWRDVYERAVYQVRVKSCFFVMTNTSPKLGLPYCVTWPTPPQQTRWRRQLKQLLVRRLGAHSFF